MWLPKGFKAFLTCYAECKEEVLLFILLILPPNLSVIKAENTWLLDYDSSIWFCKWTELGEVWISDQIHMKSVDDMQTHDTDIQILFDFIYNSSLQYFTLFEKSPDSKNQK